MVRPAGGSAVPSYGSHLRPIQLRDYSGQTSGQTGDYSTNCILSLEDGLGQSRRVWSCKSLITMLGKEVPLDFTNKAYFVVNKGPTKTGKNRTFHQSAVISTALSVMKKKKKTTPAAAAPPSSSLPTSTTHSAKQTAKRKQCVVAMEQEVGDDDDDFIITSRQPAKKARRKQVAR